MKVTLDGKPVKTVEELQVGESGYISSGAIHRGRCERSATVWPSPVNFEWGCYRVTRVTLEDALTLEYIPDADEKETLVVAVDAAGFCQQIATLQDDDWRIDADSIRVTPNGTLGLAYLAVLRKEGE